MRVIGAGLGRTGTASLKIALERLLDGPCYHMSEVFERPGDVPIWHSAVRGEPVDWGTIFSGYEAAVDFPTAVFWEELADAYPDAYVLLSVRDADSWWRSARETILPTVTTPPDPDASDDRRAWHAMVGDLFRTRFATDLSDETAVKAAFDRHLAAVRAGIDPERLVEWHPSRGWEPLCDTLGLPVPGDPFPHTNTTEEFLARRRARPAGPA